MAGHVRVGDGEFWVDERGDGPAVLLLAGLGDPAEVWTAQLEALRGSYRVIAFDNRGVGRTPEREGAPSVADMADDAAAVLRALRVPRAHVAGFSGGSAIAQELALRHPELVRSLVLVSTWARPDAYFLAVTGFWHWMVEAAPSERALLEAFYVWIYTPRAHEDGTVARLVDEVLAFPHKQSAGSFQAQLAAFRTHDSLDRLAAVSAPTLVQAGELDAITPPRLGRVVADAIPGARFEVLAGEAHQPFQEAPDAWNARVEAFWRELDGR